MTKKKTKRILKKVLVFLLFTSGLCLSLYPTAADIYGKYRDSKLMTKYEQSTADMNEVTKAKLLQDAIDYNNNLTNLNNGNLVTQLQHKNTEDHKYNTEVEEDTYNSMLKSGSSSIMGTLSIPSIAVTLPLYHWSSEDVLEKGIGHIHGSSLPVGNGVDPEDANFSNIKGSHSLFIGHRGLPSLKLFSDLDDVKTGEMFYIKVLDKIYAYKIYDIETVLPDEVEELKIEPGKDLCTLITCTPYGVNTHRILVHGERVPYNGEETEASIVSKIINTIDPKTVLGIGFIGFITIILAYKKRKKRKQKGNKVNDEEIFNSNTSISNSSE